MSLLRLVLLCLMVSFSTFHDCYASDTNFQQSALSFLKESVSYRTAAGYKQTIPFAQRIAERFINAGFSPANIWIFELETDDTCSLVIRYRGSDSTLRPIILMAHMDVVDAHPEDWTYPPFVLTQEDGRLYGRGVMDNKGGLVAITETMIAQKKSGFEPKRDIYFVLTGDEETMAQTTRLLFSQLPELLRAKLALNSDAGLGVLGKQKQPVYFQLQTSEKTYAAFELTAKNPGGHSSIPRSDNAIYELSAALIQLQNYRFPIRFTDSTLEYFAKTAKLIPGEIGDNMAVFARNPENTTAINFLDSMPGEAAMIRTTCVATMLDAGHAENALPQTASATVNCRVFPGVGIDEVEQLFTTAISNEDIEIHLLFRPGDNPPSPLRTDVENAVTASLRQHYPGIPVIPYQSPYSTDGAIFRANGIDTYGVGGQFIVYPDDKRSHGQDEFLPIESFVKSLDYWDVLIREISK